MLAVLLSVVMDQADPARRQLGGLPAYCAMGKLWPKIMRGRLFAHVAAWATCVVP